MAFPPPAESQLSEAVSLPLPHPDAYDGEPREYARALMQRKDDIEKEIDALNEALASHGATPTSSLFDPEGYPRADIDVWAIRHVRSSLARLRTDRAQINSLLAPALEAAFSVPAGAGAAAGASGSSSSPAAGRPNGHAPLLSLPNGHALLALQPPPLAASPGERTGGQHDEDVWPTRAIARVDSVSEGSPSFESGLRAGDVVFQFGNVSVDSGEGMRGIGELVSRSDGIALPLLVMRGDQRVRLSLTPRSGWGGRGLLGCHIVPP